MNVKVGDVVNFPRLGRQRVMKIDPHAKSRRTGKKGTALLFGADVSVEEFKAKYDGQFFVPGFVAGVHEITSVMIEG